MFIQISQNVHDHRTSSACVVCVPFITYLSICKLITKIVSKQEGLLCGKSQFFVSVSS